MSKVTEIKPPTGSGIAIDNKAIADKLRGLADEIENGQSGNLNHLLVISSSPQSLQLDIFGKAILVSQLVGLLEMIKLREVVKLERERPTWED